MSLERKRVGALLLPLVACALFYSGSRTSATADPAEVRGLWVLRSSLTSPLSVANLVRTASANGFNTLFVQVRGRGEAFYHSSIEPRATELDTQASEFDPLADVIASAHAAGMRVHAWVNVNLVASAAQLPEDRAHVIYRHPDWLMVPRAIVQDLRPLDGHSPAYSGKISRWTRQQSDHVEGLYLSPVLPEAADYTVSVITELVSRYALDGVHLDYIRYPNADFDYSRYAMAEFRSEIAPTLPSPTRARLDKEREVDPFAYPDALPEAYAQFRRARLSTLAMRLKSAVHRARPSAIVSAAVVPDADEAVTTKLQDWRTWVESGILDAICPMAYTTDATVFAEQVTAARAVAGSHRVWAGIGAWRLTPEQTVHHIGLARKAGAAGLVLFSYDSLTGPSQARGDYLEEIARAAFTISTATAPGGKP